MGSLVDETPSTEVDYHDAEEHSGLLGGHSYSSEDDDDATGPLGGPMDALDAIAMDVACEEPRFGAIVDGLREGIHNQQMLRAARIMFEDYGPVRVCVRVMMRLLVRRMRDS